VKNAARFRYTFYLPEDAAEWAGSALADVFPDGLLLTPVPGKGIRLEGWLKAGRQKPDSNVEVRLKSLGAGGVRGRLDLPALHAPAAFGKFPVLRLGRFWIVPAADAGTLSPPKGAYPIILTQGQAFGSGRHESTRLMLRFIEELQPKGLEVLDVGAGSGILGFACLHLGAARVTNVEIESAAAAEMRQNRILNGRPAADFPVVCGRFPVRRLEGRSYPLVLANLVTPVLCALMGGLAARVANGGRLLTSGIHTDAEAAAVAQAARKAGLRFERGAQLKRWHVQRFLRP
jgi:ribosomal protein L11 methylase PrmA